MEGATASQMQSSALQRGMVTLRMDGIQKVLDRKTTPDEVLRVTHSDIALSTE